MMVTLTVAAILVTLAMPSFSELIQRNRLATQVNDFMTALSLARSEAVKRGSRVTVCKSSDLSTCTTTGGWEQGWIIYADVTNIGTVDAGEILRVHGSLQGGVSSTSASTVADYISFISNGATQKIDGSFQAGTLKLCLSTSGKAKEIIINSTGRARVAEGTCS